jgi:hypothetical protein
MSELQEAVSLSAFHARVEQLHHGELARMPDGGAVKFVKTEDNRDAWVAGSPSRWGEGGLSWDGEQQPSAEAAVKAAMRRSAASTHPLSVGGDKRITRWSPMIHHGTEVRVAEFTVDGKAVVHPPENPAKLSTVDPAHLLPARTHGGMLGEAIHDPVFVPWAQLREAKESLNRSPKKNWVEKAGGLPQAIVHMAKDIHQERGIPISEAIPVAISRARQLAAKGNAKYVAAIAQWEKMKAHEGVSDDEAAVHEMLTSSEGWA